MEVFLITLAGAGLLGCLFATCGSDTAARGRRTSRRLRRPKTLALGRE
ncbi:hypothetical protein [uncultured Enterovirga sp.]